MAFWRHSAFNLTRLTTLTIVAMGSMPQYDCDPLAEPATRLERCIERTVKQMKRQGEVVHATCDLKLPGRFVVVLHPPGELSNDELITAGLPESLVPELRALRMKGSPAMYVMAADRTVTGTGGQRTVQSSRTTTQSTFVEINELMVVTRITQPLTVEVGRTATASVVRRMR